MNMIDKFPQHIRELYQDGENYSKNLLTLLDEWPIGEYSRRVELNIRPDEDKERISEALYDIERWLNSLSLKVLPRTIHDKRKLKDIWETLKYAILEEEYKQNSKDDVKKAMDEALSLILSIPLPREKRQLNYTDQRPVPNTAFIIMSMDPSQHDLEDVCNAIKEVCFRFGIQAVRADDLQHQGMIPDVIFEYISNSEFIIADLTGERPNVFYEVGLAHAIKKRPILIRKQDTPLPFDLSVYNVPEYKNITELKKLLHERLEALIGRKVA